MNGMVCAIVHVYKRDYIRDVTLMAPVSISFITTPPTTHPNFIISTLLMNMHMLSKHRYTQQNNYHACIAEYNTGILVFKVVYCVSISFMTFTLYFEHTRSGPNPQFPFSNLTDDHEHMLHIHVPQGVGASGWGEGGVAEGALPLEKQGGGLPVPQNCTTK